ncbi:hypothetical protein QR680_005985 [Steinernema hermaphroditum]|uniref:Beta-galactosidase n=1 Tax=Steinernema hermaphroditum TaxID=289476 RepID=A0AA39HW46_9BILA|nr:hypothetical protein QR680_005985 [Steinernema hermaphroditum]
MLLLSLLFIPSALGQLFGNGYRFEVGRETFLVNGRPFRYISGSIHYFRIHLTEWNDRLAKVRAAGLNAIQFYVPWNFHEYSPGSFNFNGARDISRFLRLAQENELYALVRLGPYICGEWENGGLPWWLLHTKDIRMRTSDTRFLSAVQRWYQALFNVIRPHLLKNGGNILMLQLENEYGAFSACDHDYMAFLRETTRRGLGYDVNLYTTDNVQDQNLKCGTTDGAFITIDFGPGSRAEIDSYFAKQRKFSPVGPLVNSEFYPGWQVYWGQEAHHYPTLYSIIDGTEYMYSLNASFNYYVIHGGTSFGFWAGAQEKYADITSYDYDAPISEAGDTTSHYFEIQKWVKTIPNWSHQPKQPPPNSNKTAYGEVLLSRIGTPLELRNVVGQSCMRSLGPLTFEDMNFPYGFVLYEAWIPFGGRNLQIDGIKDHGFVMVNGQYEGAIYSSFGNLTQRSIAINAPPGANLAILVENRGRQFYQTINDFKGITSTVLLDGLPLLGWTQCGIEPTAVYPNAAQNQRNSNPARGPNIYMGTFRAPQLADTFFDPTGWGKGQLYINGYNVGRYWPLAGPQVTLYVPRALLRPVNTIVILELLGTKQQKGNSFSVNFVNASIFRYSKPANAFGSP